MTDILDSYEILDDDFRELIDPASRLVRLWTGAEFGEGPAYFPAARYLVWTDIPNDRMLRYDECSEQVQSFVTLAVSPMAIRSIVKGGW